MLPKDPNLLLSILNMKLRDFYSSLDAMCDDMEENKEEIKALMDKAGYCYQSETNSFIRKKER